MQIRHAFLLLFAVFLLPAGSAFAAKPKPNPNPAPIQQAAAPAKLQITWLGHASFQLVSPQGTSILIDPFMAGNPATPAQYKDLAQYKPNLILISHSHFDHSADALAIAKQSGAKVISTFDAVSAMDLPDEQKMGGNVGGTFVYPSTATIIPMHFATFPILASAEQVDKAFAGMDGYKRMAPGETIEY